MKTILTILFLLLSSVVFSMDKKTQEYLFESYKTPYNLTYDVKQPTAFVKFNDFSTFYKLNSNPFTIQTVNAEQMIPFTYNGTVEWYKTDFASEPFDGRIEVAVVGEPLPSVPLTIFVSTLLLFTYLKYRKIRAIHGIS